MSLRGALTLRSALTKISKKLKTLDAAVSEVETAIELKLHERKPGKYIPTPRRRADASGATLDRRKKP